MTLALAGVLLSLQVQVPYPYQPPRDAARPPTEATGTGVIRGRVVSGDTGAAIRRATVNLSFAPTRPARGATPDVARGTQVWTYLRPRQAITDSQGAFEFKNLPPGSYHVYASPGQFAAQYVGIPYGARRPTFDPGLAIELSSGEVFERATIALPRAAVIVGRVTDEAGEPLSHVQVYGLWFPPGSTRGQRNSGGTSTDDLGQYRLYGLQPGEYAVVAEARMPMYISPNMDVQADSEEGRLGFMTTYYPGTPDEIGAQHVRAASGAETAGVDIRVVQGRLLRVSGMVSDSQGRPMKRASGQITRRLKGSLGMSSFPFGTDEQGRFDMRNIPPGNYRLTVRQNPPNYTFNGSDTNDPGEIANEPLSLNGTDIEDLVIVTSPGVTIHGQVVFEPAPPPRPVQLRIGAVAGDPEISGVTPAASIVDSDLTFTMKGLFGEYLLRTGGPGVFLKSVSVGGEDVTDVSRRFKAQDRITIVLSTRGSTLEGSVTDDKGAPATEAGIIMFPEDKASWRGNAVRVRRGGPDPNGHYAMNGLQPGRYFVIAIPRERMNISAEDIDAAYFEALAKDATRVLIGEDEQRTVDLRVVGGGI